MDIGTGKSRGPFLTSGSRDSVADAPDQCTSVHIYCMHLRPFENMY